MAVFIIRRLLNAIPTIFGVALIVFVLFNIVGGDPTIAMMGKHGNEATRLELRHELGLDQSMPKQFVDFLGQIATFDFGRSWATKQKVSGMILAGIGPSLSLAVPAFFLTTILGILLGLVVAYNRGKWIDRVVTIVSIVGISFPGLALILFGQYYFAYYLGLFPISGFEPAFPDFIPFIILPAIIWVMVSLGGEIRFFRTAMLEEVNQDYVRTARAKGVSESKIFLKHVLKNSMVPILTSVVIEIPQLILGALLFEQFFGIPGLGYITVAAINNSDFQVIKAMSVLTALLLIFGIILTDILYMVVDPRVRMR